MKTIFMFNTDPPGDYNRGCIAIRLTWPVEGKELNLPRSVLKVGTHPTHLSPCSPQPCSPLSQWEEGNGPGSVTRSAAPVLYWLSLSCIHTLLSLRWFSVEQGSLLGGTYSQRKNHFGASRSQKPLSLKGTQALLVSLFFHFT